MTLLFFVPRLVIPGLRLCENPTHTTVKKTNRIFT